MTNHPNRGRSSHVSKHQVMKEIGLAVIRARAALGLSTKLEDLKQVMEGAGYSDDGNFYIWNLREDGLVKRVGPAEYLPT